MADTPIYLDRFVQRFVETVASLHLGTRDWILIIAIFVLGFSYLLSRAVGWRELAMHYAAGDRFQGEPISLFDSDGEEFEVEVLLNNSSVSGSSIKLGADGKGIYLWTWIGLRLFHPPLFIPWKDITCERLTRKELWIRKDMVQFNFALAPGIPLEVRSNVAAEIQKRSEGRWTMPESGRGNLGKFNPQ